MELRTLCLVATITATILAACTGDTPGLTPGQSDGGTPTDSGEGITDAGNPEEEGELIVDGGGGNPDEDQDAGVIAVDGGDGGPVMCGPASGDGATVQSTCATRSQILAGGVIPVGSYDLTGFTVTGTTTFCGTYAPAMYSGRLDVESAAAGTYVLRERTSRTGIIARAPNKSFSATASGSQLTVAQTCGTAVKSTQWGYTVSKSGATIVTYVHDSGTATVRYRWTKR